jgi:hypothetical protein
MVPVRTSIAGGCTVTTRETASEAAWAALTFHAIHALPVVIVCDTAAHDEMSARALPEGIVLQRMDFPAQSRVRAHNKYHRADVIAAKMLALKLAIVAFGDAVFFDADMTFLGKMPAPQDNELMLSPNFEDFVTRGQHGFYNAGLVWSSRVDFCDWWRDEYTSGRSRFYEQSALDIAPSKWRSSYFGSEHNHGFWRGAIGSRRVESVHCHLSTALDASMSQWALDRTLALRAECLALIHSHPLLSCYTPPH